MKRELNISWKKLVSSIGTKSSHFWNQFFPPVSFPFSENSTNNSKGLQWVPQYPKLLLTSLLGTLKKWHKVQKNQVDTFFNYLNYADPYIQSTIESPDTDCSISSLDTMGFPNKDHSIQPSVYINKTNPL